ncbi:ferric reductase-like transmembrane domain-containing protein [Streptomyces sp. JJ36]|uniref:ferredoxin reductase family protein n=1 Tax=Streptomyces sp. JJ36 TaxID=2736645 RepID=UPI001F266AF1|nr:ferredoxin reductase family protein [Streptomyces sp. JJ36]MCF6525497.1 ferredoxin reductase family protein [Streptomyces sp. JJ36]
MTTIQYSRAGRRQARRGIRPRRSPAVPLLVLAWSGAVAVLSLWWRNTPAVPATRADWLVHAGRISGLLAGYGIALVVVQMARVPALERRVGSDRVARWHAMTGRYALSLTVAHVGLIVYGYALQEGSPLVPYTVTLVTGFPAMAEATAGTLLLFLVGFVSVGALRRRLRYELWYYLHLLTYPAVYLVFWHQLATGSEFAGDPFATTAWYALYGAAAALLVWYRVLTPVRLNLRHRMRVDSVVPEVPGVVSVLIRGRRLHRLHAEAGHFFRWRFLAPGLWWTANPYSLSAPPRPDLMRITVKAAGGHSAALAGLRPGTRIWAEGPYGALTAARRRRGKVLLLAGGAGITPLRALFETLPGAPGDLTLLYRARSAAELALREELEAIAGERGARLLYAVNSPDGRRPVIDAEWLREALPDVAEHDVYLCGPPGLAEEWFSTLREAGVPERRIHHESFEF